MPACGRWDSISRRPSSCNDRTAGMASSAATYRVESGQMPAANPPTHPGSGEEGFTPTVVESQLSRRQVAAYNSGDVTIFWSRSVGHTKRVRGHRRHPSAPACPIRLAAATQPAVDRIDAHVKRDWSCSFRASRSTGLSPGHWSVGRKTCGCRPGLHRHLKQLGPKSTSRF